MTKTYLYLYTVFTHAITTRGLYIFKPLFEVTIIRFNYYKNKSFSIFGLKSIICVWAGYDGVSTAIFAPIRNWKIHWNVVGKIEKKITCILETNGTNWSGFQILKEFEKHPNFKYLFRFLLNFSTRQIKFLVIHTA